MLTSLVSNLIINYTGTVLLCYNSNTVAKLLYYTLSYLTPVCSVMHKIYTSEVSYTQRCSQNLAVQIYFWFISHLSVFGCINSSPQRLELQTAERYDQLLHCESPSLCTWLF